MKKIESLGESNGCVTVGLLTVRSTLLAAEDLARASSIRGANNWQSASADTQ